MKISEKIQRLRAENGMAQEEFGKIAGASNKAISFWEKGEKTPRLKKDQKTEAGRRDVVLLDAMAAAHNWVSRPFDGPMERCEESGRARQGETYGMTKRGRALALPLSAMLCRRAGASVSASSLPECLYTPHTYKAAQGEGAVPWRRKAKGTRQCADSS